MNTPRLIPTPVELTGERIHFDDFEISWAGENPLTGDLWFGSDGGRIRTKDAEGPVKPTCPSGEAVNGIAFTGQSMVMSTRCDVVLITREADGQTHRAIYDGGAHDVIATHSGGFVAPLGVHGILTMRPTSGPLQLLAKCNAVGDRPNFYKFASCTGDGEIDLIVGACRGDGLTIIEFNSLENRIKPGNSRLLQLPGLDVVDVCSLRSSEWPRAVAWLNIDRTIYLSRDVLEDHPIKSLRIGNIPGKAYSLLHDRGHFFLLTNKGFYMLPDLASRFLSGTPDGGPTQVLAHRSESIDEIYMGGDSLLLSIDGDIYRTPMDSIMTEADRSGWSSHFEGIPELSDIAWEKTIGLQWSIAA